MYLAHHLLVLGPKWQKSLDGRRLSYSIAFCDQVKEFRDLGTHVLLTHMRAQRKQLLDTLRSSGMRSTERIKLSLRVLTVECL